MTFFSILINNMFYFINTGHRLHVNKLDIDKDTCEATLRWSHPSEDFDLISSYIVYRYSFDNNRWQWFNEGLVSVGTNTQYSTGCTLQSGRLYFFGISLNVSLTDPDETIAVYSLYRYVVMGMTVFLWMLFKNKP